MVRIKLQSLKSYLSGRRRLRLRPIHVAIVVVVLVTSVVTALTASGASLGRLSGTWYVAMGDSYSSGEGVPPFIPGTDTTNNQCHRSTRAYSEDLSGTPGFPIDSAFVACSGAKIANFYPGKGQYNETEGQLAALRSLGSTVSLVSLTAGGNDVEFANIMKTCVVVFGCEGLLAAPTALLVRHTVGRLTSLYRAILADAPNAQVYILGYPHMFSKHPPIFCNGIDIGEAHWITSMENMLNSGIASNIAHIRDPRLHYVDTSAAFAGGELCTGPNPIYMNGIIRANQAYSFHPTAAGQRRLAEVLAIAVRGR